MDSLFVFLHQAFKLNNLRIKRLEALIVACLLVKFGSLDLFCPPQRVFEHVRADKLRSLLDSVDQADQLGDFLAQVDDADLSWVADGRCRFTTTCAIAKRGTLSCSVLWLCDCQTVVILLILIVRTRRDLVEAS